MLKQELWEHFIVPVTPRRGPVRAEPSQHLLGLSLPSMSWSLLPPYLGPRAAFQHPWGHQFLPQQCSNRAGLQLPTALPGHGPSALGRCLMSRTVSDPRAPHQVWSCPHLQTDVLACVIVVTAIQDLEDIELYSIWLCVCKENSLENIQLHIGGKCAIVLYDYSCQIRVAENGGNCFIVR